eukprot:scaffold259559_cov18-Tisochrysis_lutea.AAC.1
MAARPLQLDGCELRIHWLLARLHNTGGRHSKTLNQPGFLNSDFAHSPDPQGTVQATALYAALGSVLSMSVSALSQFVLGLHGSQLHSQQESCMGLQKRQLAATVKSMQSQGRSVQALIRWLPQG